MAACGPLQPEITSEQAMPEFPDPDRICPHCGATMRPGFSQSYDLLVSNDAPPALQGLAVLLQHLKGVN